MCGIAGSTEALPGILEGMAGLLRHRGPDDQGCWRDSSSRTGLAHTRLAIIDLSPGGHQPMLSPCGRYAIAFNGEIYNYAELKSDLAAKGEIFASSSDTEVLLRLLMREGRACLDRLVGMFAFAFWDRETQSLLLARDRLGIKPLVYASLPDGGLAFASEIEALKRHPGLNQGLDREALSQYLACLYVPHPRTLYAGIRKLPPGHWLAWRNGRIETACWWKPSFTGQRTLALDEAVEELLPALKAAVESCLVADVEVGCFLSGGIDSGVIAALMADAARRQGAPQPQSFTMTFESERYDERHAASATARHAGLRHTELAAEPHLASALPDLLRAFGEPFGNPTSLLVLALSKAARQHVRVALVGDGGDEVFAGYPRYQGGLLAQRYARMTPSWLRRSVVAPLAALIPESQTGRHALRRAREFLTAPDEASERYASWVEYFDPEERQEMLGLASRPERPIASLYRASQTAGGLDAMQETDLLSFLPGNLLAYGDAMSMQHALELRLPLLDHRLVDIMGALSPGLRMAEGKKTLLRACAKRLLPQDVVQRPKLGFNPPMGEWLRKELQPLLSKYVTPERMEALGIAWRPVARLLNERRRDNSLKIWALLVLSAWDEHRQS
jgi:asparagine synthase (glutamine-hydrolysing)